jgi:hypothetical protein
MGEITLQQALEEFKTVYMPARNLAARAREEYSNDLKGFIDFLEKAGVTKAGKSQYEQSQIKNTLKSERIFSEREAPCAALRGCCAKARTLNQRLKGQLLENAFYSQESTNETSNIESFLPEN